MTGNPSFARLTFDAMPASDRENLAKITHWLEPGYKRKPGEHLVGYEYYALIVHGVLIFDYVDEARGREIKVTDLGRAVLHYIEGGL